MGNVQHTCTSCGKEFIQDREKLYQNEDACSRGFPYSIAPNCPHCSALFMPNKFNIPGVGAAFGFLFSMGTYLTTNSDKVITIIQAKQNYDRARKRCDRFKAFFDVACCFLFGIWLFQIICLSRYYLASAEGRFSFVYHHSIFSDLMLPPSVFVLYTLLSLFSISAAYYGLREWDKAIEEHLADGLHRAIAAGIALVSDMPCLSPYKRTLGEVKDFWTSAATILALYAPILSLFSIHFSGLAVQARLFTSAMYIWHHACALWSGLLPAGWTNINPDSKMGKIIGFIKQYAWVGGIFAASAVIYKASTRKQKHKVARVPKKKQQIVVDDVSEYAGVDPPAVGRIVGIPSSPPFTGFNLVHDSLVQIRGGYTATAFRVGNNLVTSIHCLTKRDEEFGAFIVDPTKPGKFYWAAVEKTFPYAGSRIAGDGIAILNLPNSDYFLTRHASSISTPPKDKLYVGAYQANNALDKPGWSFSTGSAAYNKDTGNINLWASIEAGSSGGPIIHPQGTVVGVAYAESSQLNLAFGFTKEVIDFLCHHGGAQLYQQERIPCAEEYSQDSTDSESSEEESIKEEASTSGSNGPHVPPKKKQWKPKSSPGRGDNGTKKGKIPNEKDLGRDKKKEKERREQYEGSLPKQEDPSDGHIDYQARPSFRMLRKPLPLTNLVTPMIDLPVQFPVPNQHQAREPRPFRRWEPLNPIRFGNTVTRAQLAQAYLEGRVVVV